MEDANKKDSPLTHHNSEVYTKKLVGFFLEEIKEAWNDGYEYGARENVKNIEHYLKSKYGI